VGASGILASMFSTSLSYSLPRIMVAATHITSVHSWPVVTRHSKGLNPRFYPAPTIGYPGIVPSILSRGMRYVYLRAHATFCASTRTTLYLVFSLPSGILREVVLFNEGRYCQVQRFVLHRIRASEVMAPLRRPRTTGPYRP